MSNISIEYPKRVNVIGVPISAVNMEDSLNFVARNFDGIRGEYICASNVHTTVMACEDDHYMEVQRESALSLPDGKPLSVIGQRAGYARMEKTTGTHFMQAVFTDKRFEGKRHFFYGTTGEMLQRMIPQIRKDYPSLMICGTEPSVFRELSDAEVNDLADRINYAEADFVWIALGAPRQELLMHRLKGKTHAVMTGVGGAFNILSGTVHDAPTWMQNAGLEWLYRFLKEPKRLYKRYLVTNTKFILYCMRVMR